MVGPEPSGYTVTPNLQASALKRSACDVKMVSLIMVELLAPCRQHVLTGSQHILLTAECVPRHWPQASICVAPTIMNVIPSPGRRDA